MTILEFLLCLILIGASGFFSGSEAALFSLTKVQLRSLRDRFKHSYQKIRRLLQDPAGLLITILILNEIINVSISTLITSALARELGEDPLNSLPVFLRPVFERVPSWAVLTLYGILVTTPVVLIFGEITPKVIGARANRMIAAMAAGPLELSYDLLRPMRWLLERLISGFRGLFFKEKYHHGRTASSEPILREEEFLSLVKAAYREGNIQEREMELIQRVFELDDTPVKDITTPISEVFSLPEHLSYRDALVAIRSFHRDHRYSRIPIYGARKDQIQGVLYSKDLLVTQVTALEKEGSVTELMRKPFRVTQDARLNLVFKRLKHHRTHLAVVENDRGEAIGIVTMNDILDALFEDLLERKA
jgi:putative hemolysin